MTTSLFQRKPGFLAFTFLCLAATLVPATAVTLTPIAVGDAPVVAAVAGRQNIALASLGGVSFASSSLGTTWTNTCVNDGLIANNGASWIPLTTAGTEYVAVKFTNAITLAAVVWHGQNGYAGRSDGTYSLEYTTDPVPSGISTWTQIGIYTYPCNTTIMPRTLFSFPPVAGVTAMRLVVGSCDAGQTAIQEFEAYEALTAAATGDTAINAAVSGAVNLALRSGGATTFASSDLNGSYNNPLVNDGNYANNAWIPVNSDPVPYVAVAFPSARTVRAAVWKGNYPNRSAGMYRLEYTTNSNPSGSSTWFRIGAYIFTPAGQEMRRTLFTFPVVTNVTAMRLATTPNLVDSMAIVEFEAYESLPNLNALTPLAIGDAPVVTAIAGRHNDNLASCGGVAFSSSCQSTTYTNTLVNDGSFTGDAWIAATTASTEYIAVKFPSPIPLAAVAWQSAYGNRSGGTYSLEYTTDPAPSGSSTWTQIGVYCYVELNLNYIMPRTLFSFSTVAGATAVRLVLKSTDTGTSGNQLAISEFEAYGSFPGLITPEAVGDVPVAAAVSGRANYALASAGGVAFASSYLLPSANFTADRVNDGLIDSSPSSYSWIPNTTASTEYVAVRFASPIALGAVVWHGETGYNGRSGGAYNLEYTTDASPSGGSCWRPIGQYVYVETSCATPIPRSLFTFPAIPGVTAMRLVTAAVSCGAPLAIQEFEGYATLGPPAITQQPVGGNVIAGGRFTFTVAANALGWQWCSNGVPIGGALSSSFTLTNVQAGNAGNYSVILTNYGGATTSSVAVLTVIPASTYTTNVLADGPIHYYPLDETNGFFATDLGTKATQNGIHTGGIMINQPAVHQGLGACAHFDGAAGTFVNLGLFHPGSNVTIEAWTKMDVDARVNFNAVVARWDGSYEMDFTPSAAPTVWLKRDGNIMGSAAGTVAAVRGQWHHLVAVFTNGLLTMFTDGIQGSVSNLGGVLQNAGGVPDRVLIGATRNGSDNSWNFKGFIDEVAVYDYALSPGQILSHYQAGITSAPVITSVPVGGTVPEGSDFTFTVAADYVQSYQWCKNGTNLPGATSPTYTLLDVRTTDAGDYTVVLTNWVGSITSTPVALAVTTMPVYGTYQDTVLADAPIHYFPFDETNGTIALDLGVIEGPGGTNTGGIVMNQPSVSSYLGRCRHFDGAGGTFVDLGLFHPGSNVTVEAWVRFDLDARTNYNAVVARWDGSYELDFDSHTGDRGGFVVRNQAATVGAGVASGLSARQQWHHIVGIFSGGSATIFVDGVQGSTSSIGGALRDGGPMPDRVMIGATRAGTGMDAYNFSGFIDEVAIYDYALTPVQIRAHYRAPAQNHAPYAGTAFAATPANQTLILTNAVLLAVSGDIDNDSLSVTAAGPISTNGGTVTLTGTNTVAYTPATDFAGLDQFSFTVSDGRGGTAVGQVVVVVGDTLKPEITCPANVVAAADAGQCSKSNVTFTATATDNNPGPVTLWCAPPSGSTFNVGPVTTVTCTAADVSGNTTNCSFTVTVLDVEPPVLGVVTASQNAVNVKDCAATTRAGTVLMSVQAGDACGIATGAVVLTNGAATESAAFLGDAGGTYNFSWTVTDLTPHGTWTVLGAAVDAAGNAVTNTFTLCVHPWMQVTGQVGMEFYVGPARDGVGSANVTFKATDDATNLLATWTMPLTFGPDAWGHGVANYTLTNVPDNTTHISARTSGHLRKRLPVTFASGVGPVNFTDTNVLPGGDTDDSALVDVIDYFRLASYWYVATATDPAAAVADIDGSGLVDSDDYFILANRWYQEGDPE